MEQLLRIPFVQRNIIHHINHGMSYIENSVINISATDNISLVYPRIYISNYSTSTNHQLLQSLGITDIITINSYFNPPLSPSSYRYHYYAAYDDDAEDITPHLTLATDLIKSILQEPERCILVHCQAGRSRSVSLVAAFIARYYADAGFRWPNSEAHEITELYRPYNNVITGQYSEYLDMVIAMMYMLRPQIRPNVRFKEQIVGWLLAVAPK
jgi:protein-tyrosine phosphatase